MVKVLIDKPIHPVALERLRQETDALTPYEAPPEEVMGLLEQADALILCTGLTIGPAEMDRASQLLVIGRHGVGLDTVDLPAASARGIPVVFAPDGPTESTAEHALTLMLATARRLSLLDRATRAGNFHIRYKVVGRELDGKALGIVGFGRIGKRLAEMCQSALHMSVSVFDPFVPADAVLVWGARYFHDLADLAASVDVLSVHVPYSAQTHHLISAQVLRALKPGAILVNACRGPVVDEQALLAALQDGHIGGAGLDVYEPEPPVANNPLFALDQVVLTPHVGSFTEEGRLRMGTMVVEDVLRVFKDTRPLYLANPDAWKRRRTIGHKEDHNEAKRT